MSYTSMNNERTLADVIASTFPQARGVGGRFPLGGASCNAPAGASAQPPADPAVDEDAASINRFLEELNRRRAAKSDKAVGDTKDTNPKDGIGATKLPLHLVSPFIKAYQAISHFLGNVKYGAWNWRAGGARASIYVSALHRHIDLWWEGEEYDQTDGTPHLANALACIGIIIDAKHSGKLVDDRPPSNSAELARLRHELEQIMARVMSQHGDKMPRHYTIADTERLKAAP